jgi:transposase
MPPFLSVGIDISKDRLDVALAPLQERWQVPYTEAALAGLAERLRSLAPALIVLEATGGYQVLAATALAAVGLPVAVVNPRQVRDFGRALGRLAKTDAIDAQLLADFAERVRPEPRPLPDATAQDLSAVVVRRRDDAAGMPRALDRAPPPGGRRSVAAPRTRRRRTWNRARVTVVNGPGTRAASGPPR